MRNKVLRWCRERALTAAGTHVICAVSGGADSVAMLHCMKALSADLSITVSAAHFNHRLRGEESDRDEAFVRNVCEKWGIPLFVSSGDAAACAKTSGKSIEEAARELRYAFFSELDGVIATAHTADDHLETVLMNLMRGTALKGLCGIPPKRENIIRPMLALSRQEIIAYLDENKLPHVEDSTNAEPSCLRNRLRHQVIPLLKAENPSLCDTVLQNALLLREQEQYLAEQADALLKKAQTANGLDCTLLREAPPALRALAVRRHLETIRAPKLSKTHIDAVCRLIESDDPSAVCDLPGNWRCRREYDRLVLTTEPSAQTFAPVLLGADTQIPLLGLRVQITKTEHFENADPDAFAAQCDDPSSIVMRPRRTGDRIRLPGGSKTLQRLFMDRKIPASQRELVPVIADSKGILAVVGIGINTERQAVFGKSAVIIKIEKEVANYDQSE